MSKKKDALVISVDKYSMFSLLVPLAYGINWIYDSKGVFDFVPPIVHTYHLVRSICDRYSFHSQGENVSKFINREFTVNDTSYYLTEIKYNYGLSLTEVVSVTGLLHNFLNFIKSGEYSIFSTIKSKLPQSFTGDNLKKAVDYTLFLTIGAAMLNMFTSFSKASLEIHYDLFEIPNEADVIPPQNQEDQKQIDKVDNEANEELTNEIDKVVISLD